MNESEVLVLTKLNQSIRNAEWERDSAFMKNILGDDLVLRRADGSFADKNTYLEALDDNNNTYDYLEQTVLDVKIDNAEKNAIVNVLVKASGRRGKDHKPFNGEFKNIRFFRKSKEWQLYAWYNEAINSPLIKHIPNGSIRYKVDKEDHFFGKALMEDSVDSPSSPDTRALYVRFENGSSTKWHWHTGVQILLVKEGIGFVEQMGFPSFEIRDGDRIYIPENVWHKHGAKPNQMMIHLAITNGKTEWERSNQIGTGSLE